MKMTIIFVLISVQIFCQENESTVFFDEEYFISENGIKSDTLLFTESQIVNIYKDYKVDSSSFQIKVSKNSKYRITKTIFGVKPGFAIMTVDTIFECNGQNKDIKLSVGDTVKYFMYMGEDISLIKYGDCGIDVINGQSVYKLIKSEEIVSEYKYIKSLNGWINPQNNKVKNIREYYKSFSKLDLIFPNPVN